MQKAQYTLLSQQNNDIGDPKKKGLNKSLLVQKSLLWTSLVALPMTALSAEEENAQQTFELPVVDVSATKINSNEQEISRSVDSVNPQDASVRTAQSSAEVVDAMPNVSASGGPRSSSQSINIRGLQGSKVLQTVDGVPVRFESGHRASYFSDPALLERIEVVKGAASSIWGSGAIGGVVAQNTLSPQSMLKDEDFAGFAKVAHNNSNDQNDLVAGLAARNGSFDWLLAGYLKDSNDLELGNGEKLEGSSNEANGVLAKQDWYISEDQKLALSYRQEQREGQIPNNAAAPLNGTSVFLIEREQLTQNVAANYTLLANNGNNEVTGALFWSEIEIDEHRVSDGRKDATEQETVGLDLHQVWKSDRMTWLLGADANRQDYSGTRSGANRPVPPEAEATSLGVYTQLEVPIYDQLSGELGLRYDDFESDARNLGQRHEEDDVSISSALIWRASDKVNLTLRRDEAFRAPSMEELYSSGTHFCMGPGFCNTFLPNPDLESEKAVNYELLGKWRFDDLIGADRLSLSASVFRNEVDNFIEQIVEAPSFGPGIPDPGNSYYVNVDEALLEGFEVEAEYRLGQTDISLGYGQVRGKDRQSGEDLTNIPADTISAKVRHMVSSLLEVGIAAQHTQDQDKTRYSENTSGAVYDDYTTVDLFGSWRPASLESLRFDLNVNNLTDRAFRRTWAQLDEAGREVVLAANYMF